MRIEFNITKCDVFHVVLFIQRKLISKKTFQLAVFATLHSSLEWEITCCIVIKHHEFKSLFKNHQFSCWLSLCELTVKFHWFKIVLHISVYLNIEYIFWLGHVLFIVCHLKRCAQLVHSVRRQKDLCSVMYKFAPCCYELMEHSSSI